MDSIIAAIISSIAALLAVILAWWLSQKKKVAITATSPTISEKYNPDEYDIYFMTYLLHDSYVQRKPYTAKELSVHHDKFGPLEVEQKLINLEKHGYLKRTNRKNEGAGLWQILPEGVDFMLKNGHALEDLIKEGRKNQYD